MRLRTATFKNNFGKIALRKGPACSSEYSMTKILNNIDRLTKDPNATLNLLNTEYKNEQKSFQETIDDANKRIEVKYQIMAEQFASYDSMINSYNVQSQTIQQSIQAMLNNPKKEMFKNP
jgi:flagellar hook-associated protein 2